MNMNDIFKRIKNEGSETLSLAEIIKCWREYLTSQGIYINPFIFKRMQRIDMLMPVYLSLLHPDRKKVKPQAGRNAPRAKITLKTLCGLWYLLLRVAYDPGFFCLLQAYSKACLAGIPYRDNWKLEPICWDIRELNHDGRIATRRLNRKHNGYMEVIGVLNKETTVIQRAKEAAELNISVSNLQWKLLHLCQELPALALKKDNATARAILRTIDEAIQVDIPDKAGKTDTADKPGEDVAINQVAARMVTELKLDADPLKVAGYLKKNLLRQEVKRLKLEQQTKERAENKAHAEKLKLAEKGYEQEIEKLQKQINDKNMQIKELRRRIAANADPARGSTKKRSS